MYLIDCFEKSVQKYTVLINYMLDTSLKKMETG